ncbi:Sodium- and chloride-dependent GABA transporter ine [Takifugu flavidus]|uniref:Sodium-and chloride-dependent GABA transporter ine n=1 Tax=Takifugu flavidus TaxID=433684 RepID=A0A5C6P3N0_9TELE|nr:Sodium- and chloride-dependent GABA transporter ine [Takifugu flavidus]
MSSYNSFNNNVLKDTLTISIVNSLTSILAGFVIFSAFGYMCYLQGIPVTDLAVDGPGLVFIVYPQALANMPVAQLWSVLFFLMLLCLGLDSEGGIYIFQLLDYYTAIVSLLFVSFFEVIAVCSIYGVSRLSNILEEMTGKRPNIFFRTCWLVIAPVLITGSRDSPVPNFLLQLLWKYAQALCS